MHTSYIPKLFTELRSYTKQKALCDLFAGITVGIVALPLAMAFAIASGLSPERGIFTAIVAGFLISALGGSKVQIGGPTGAFVVLVSSITIQYGYSGLAVCTIIAGILLILFGLCKMGGLIKFIPFPVTTGFTTGIAVIIFSTQIQDLLGLKISSVPAEFIGKWHSYFTHITSFNLQAAAIGIGTIVTIILVQKIWPKLPAMLIGMTAATLVAYIFHLNIETIGSRFGDLPSVLPAPTFPSIDFSSIGMLIKPAFTIALLAAIESLLSATVADGMTGGRHRPNAELIGQGIANIGSIIFGGIPATGAIARTATNVKSGAKTPVAGMIHAITLALLLLLLAPAAKLIPLAALAGILIIVSYNMSELHHFFSILKGAKSDALVLVITCGLTILVDLTVGVEVGVVLAALLFVKHMSEVSNVGVIAKEDKEEIADDPEASALQRIPAGVEIFEVTGPLFFGMIDVFKNAMRNIEKPVSILIIQTRDVSVIDSTGIHVLRELFHKSQKQGTKIVFAGVNDQLTIAFEKSGLLEEIGKQNFCENIDCAIKRCEELIERQK